MRRTYDILIALVAAYIFITFPLYTGPAARGVARLLARRQG